MAIPQGKWKRRRSEVDLGCEHADLISTCVHACTALAHTRTRKHLCAQVGTPLTMDTHSATAGGRSLA